MDLPTFNRQWRVARRPLDGEPVGDHNFDLVSSPMPVPEEGEILVQVILLGTSPAQRSYITGGVGMHSKLGIGDPMRGRGLGIVRHSRHPAYREGEIVIGSLGWQDYALLRPDGTTGTIFDIYKVDNPVWPLRLHLGTLGAAGMTAYFGLTKVGQVQPGDTVLVSAAAGGVGSAAVQIARALGGRVIGIAGSDDKCAWLRDTLKADASINYRSADLAGRLRELAPDGINVYFDNVGGTILNTVLDHLALRARVIICGLIATDYAPGERYGPPNYTRLLRYRSRMEGFFVQDHAAEFPVAERQLRAWYDQGVLLPIEDPSQGLETMPAALGSLFAGGNRGVRLCQVAPDPSPG
ncbi:zinc-binding dehydrogenase [Niveispirillum fermenti]|uniref:zinc-binding dehydrogenase n=1 Tax=Niveispirillum fermenti TaxID=1233113 RepID=UPI003A8A8907